MNSTTRRLTLLTCLVSFVLLAVGCAESAKKVEPEEGNQEASGSYVLVPAVEKKITGHVSEKIKIAAMLFDKKSGKAVDGEYVFFDVQQQNSTRASLDARRIETDESGRADVDLNLGGRAGKLRVQANHDKAEPITFEVSTLGYGDGTLNIEPVNTAKNIMSFESVKLRLYSSENKSCSFFQPYRDQPQALETKKRTDIDGQISFENIDSRAEFLVTAQARGAQGQVAGGGCIDRISIPEDGELTKKLHMQLVQIDPSGRYRVTSQWNFTQALKDSGAAGTTIMRILNVFERPGEAIYDEIIRLIRTYVSGLLAEGIDKFMRITGLNHEFKDLVIGVIESVNALSKIRDAGQDLRDIVANLEVQSVLTIGQMSKSRAFRGTTNWLRVRLYWRWNCGENAPDDCGRISLGANENGEIAQLGLLSSSWNGRVVAYDQLRISEHPLSIRYGRLISYILEEVLLPALTNGRAHKMSKAFSLWICEPLAEGVTGDNDKICALNHCIEQKKIDNTCSSAASTVFGFADTLVNQLKLKLNLSVAGRGKLLETNSDRKVDKIVDGKFQGTLENVAGQQSPVFADWTAERMGPDESF